MSKFLEDCKLKLDKWVEDGQPEILPISPMVQLAWNYFFTSSHNRTKVIDQIIKINNKISKSDEKILALKNNIIAFIGESMSFAPILGDPTTMKYLVPRADLPEDRNFLFENFYGKGEKFNVSNIEKVWVDFSIPLITSLLLIVKYKEFDKNFNQKEIYKIINSELEDSYKFAKSLLKNS